MAIYSVQSGVSLIMAARANPETLCYSQYEDLNVAARLELPGLREL